VLFFACVLGALLIFSINITLLLCLSLFFSLSPLPPSLSLQFPLSQVLERGYNIQDEVFLHREQRGKLPGVETLSSKEDRQWAAAGLEGKIVRRCVDVISFDLLFVFILSSAKLFCPPVTDSNILMFNPPSDGSRKARGLIPRRCPSLTWRRGASTATTT